MMLATLSGINSLHLRPWATATDLTDRHRSPQIANLDYFEHQLLTPLFSRTLSMQVNAKSNDVARNKSKVAKPNNNVAVCLAASQFATHANNRNVSMSGVHAAGLTSSAGFLRSQP